jgi:Bacterial aa3 type cytochrome c oxidase subunit IV
MAEHSSDNHAHGMDEHTRTYEGFVKGSVALSLICGFVLVALVSFAFVETYNVFLGFAGLIAGIIAVLIDARTGGRWLLSLGALVVFGLITAIKVS